MVSTSGILRRALAAAFIGHRRCVEALALNITNFDILHLHSVFLWPTSAAARAARKAGVPYVLSPRGMLVGDLIRRKSSLAKRAWIALFERRNIEKAAAVHLTSEIEASELRALGLSLQAFDSCAQWHRLARTRMVKPGTKANIYIRYASPLCAISWSFELEKGPRSSDPCDAAGHNADLLIAGNDEENYRPELEALARRCGVADRVRFLGPVDGEKKWELLSSAELLALALILGKFWQCRFGGYGRRLSRGRNA